MIVLENLTLKGYFQESIKHDLHTSKIVLKNLAQLHAMSYSTANERPGSPIAYLSKYPFLEERMCVDGRPELSRLYDNLLRTRLAILSLALEPDNSYPGKI